MAESEKPAFDPNKPFTIAQADSKPAFDSSKPFEPVKAEERPWYSVTPSGLASAFAEYIPSLPKGDPNRPAYDVSAKGTGQAFLNAIPAAGAIAGSVAGPLGAGAGGVAGESLRSTIQSAVSGENPTREDFYSGLGKAGKMAIATQMGAESIPPMIKGAANIARKTPSELTGVPDREIEAYASRADKINQTINDSKSEGKFDSQLAANHMRDNVLNDVKRTRTELNNHIEQALKTSPHDPIIPVDPVRQAFEKAISQMDPVYDADQIAKTKEVLAKIDQKAPGAPAMSVQDMQKTKNYLYDLAKGSYTPSSEFFQIGDKVAGAAKMAGGAAKESLDTLGPEAIKNANRQLSQLHDIEEMLGSSVLDKNKPANSLFSVGAGSNPKDAMALRNLGKITGGNYTQDATDLSAARTFSDPTLLPSIKTGRALLGPAIGGTIGGAAGAVFGDHAALLGAKVGAGLGVALSSPAALKAAIDAGRIPVEAAMNVAAKLNVPPDIGSIFTALQSPKGIAALSQAMPSAAQNVPKMSTTIKARKTAER